MKNKLLKNYILEVRGKKIKIRIFESFENDNPNPVFIALSSYKSILVVEDSIENLKEKIKTKISLKMDVEDGKIRLISYNEAFEIAKKQFWEHFKGRIIPDEIIKQLTYGHIDNLTDFNFEIVYHNPTFSLKDFNESFLDEPSELMVSIRVNRVTGQTDIIESPQIKW